MTDTILVEVWLYGALARFGKDRAGPGYAHVQAQLSAGARIADLLNHLGLPTEERGITFINGQLSAMPGLQPDLSHVLLDGDRVGIFDPQSMWPFQYRHGAAMIEELAQAMQATPEAGLHHSYRMHDEADE